MSDFFGILLPTGVDFAPTAVGALVGADTTVGLSAAVNIPSRLASSLNCLGIGFPKAIYSDCKNSFF